MIESVNERTTAYLTVTMRDKAGALAAPSGLSYRIDCLTTGTEILADTALTPADTVEIELTATQNRIITEGNKAERRRVTVSATYGADDELHEDYEYQVCDLAGVST